MKLKKFFTVVKKVPQAAKIAYAVGYTLSTGKVHDKLKEVGVYIDVTENVVRAIEKAAKDVTTN